MFYKFRKSLCFTLSRQQYRIWCLMDFPRHSGLIEEQGGPWSGPFGKHCIPAPPPPTPHTHMLSYSNVPRVLEVTRLAPRFYQIYSIIKSALGALKAAIQRQYAIWEHIDLPRFGLPMPLSDPYPMLPPGTSLVAQMLRGLLVTRETLVQSLGWKIPWRRKWQPTPVFLPGKSNGWRSLASYSPWSPKESDTTELLHFTPCCSLLSHFSRVRLCATPSLGFSRQELTPC